MDEIKAGLNNINTYWANAQTRMDSNIADGEAFLAQQEAEDQKIAAAQRKQAQLQLQAQRRNTANQRAKKNKDVAVMNDLRDSTNAALKEVFDQVEDGALLS